jgi:hypothetical protein
LIVVVVLSSHIILRAQPEDEYSLLRATLPDGLLTEFKLQQQDNKDNSKHEPEKTDSSPFVVIPSVARQLTLPHHHTNNNQTTETTPLTILAGNDCVCDLMSIDCLHMMSCLPSSTLAEQQNIAMGVLTRQAIKQVSTFKGTEDSWPLAPIGKGIQYSSISSWQRFLQQASLPVKLNPASSIFVNETWYKYCAEHDELKGKSCFLDELDRNEDLYELEMDALVHANLPHHTQKVILEDVKFFQSSHQQRNANNLPALGYLLSFAHFVRMRFHLQPFFFHDVYERRLRRSVNNNNKKEQQDSNTVLKVSLHMRRADACNHKREGYETQPTPLDSPAQVSGMRKCYATSVYMDALQRVQQSVSKDTTIEVYLATDYAGSVLTEIREQYKELYKSMNWNYLKYSSSTFKYDGYIEGDGVDKDKQALLGESAIADLLLVSHGQVFIGHLGSRFGKLSWLLATARRNAFVPFFSVDGHRYVWEMVVCHSGEEIQVC